jgi:two-component system cell cycle sensor histidine kinase/response regulator CckA
VIFALKMLDKTMTVNALTRALKVLIIDDEATDREIFKQYLDADRPGAFLYAEAATGRDGLSQRKSFNPDCILLDLNLPDLDGLKMIRLLHGDCDMLPCAVVMLTGAGNEEVAVEAMKLGVMDYMVKGPASAHALSRIVASAVQRFRDQEEIAEQRLALEQRNLELEAIRAELFDEKERYRILAETIPQLVWTADSNGCIHYANQRLREFNGNVNAKLWPLESLVHADDRTDLRIKWSDAVRSGCAFESELRLRRAKDQTWRWHLMRTAPIRTTDGGPVRWFGTFTDIEDQKRAEEAIRQREKLAGIGLLAGGVAHDFNNLLAGIMGGASIARDSLEKGHSAYPMLEIVLRSSERAAELTQQLLAYAGKVDVCLEPADISQVARDACEPVRTSIPKNIHLKIETARDIPVIETNAGHIQQVIVNLVMNAVEAIGEASGVVTVRTAMEPVGPGVGDSGDPQSNVLGYELPAGKYVLVEVSDSGPGMDDQMQTKIFDPFFTTKFMGRGLGLAAVQGIVRSLGGGIRVSSAAGSGSAFQVLLPARDAALKGAG